MKNFFDEKGNITDYGRNIMTDFTYGLFQLIGSDDVESMTENELQMLGSHLASMTSNAVSKKISLKLQQRRQFDVMTDDQFYVYLKEKYGELWQFLALTEEELSRVPRLTDQQINEALEEGARQRKLIEDATSNYVPSGLIFK